MSRTRRTNIFILPGANFTIEFKEATTISSTMTSHNHFSQTHDTTMSSRQAILAFIVTVLLSFLQLKYQGKDQSPFETHPKTMFGAITSLLVYCLLYDANSKLSAINDHIDRHTDFYACLLRFSMAFFGPLSLASISSILFPESLCLPLFSVSILFSICQLSQSQIKTTWKWIRAAIMDTFSHHLHQQGTRRGGIISGTRRGGIISGELPRFREHVYMDQLDVLALV